MKRHTPFRLVFLCLATLSASSFADVITLKSGGKVEGKITAETDADVTITVKSGGIIDEQTLKKSDIASVTKDAPDELAWQTLKGLKLGKNSLPLASYDAALNPLNGFVNQFPQSKFAADAKKIADEFAAEKKRIEAGEVKLDDKWLSKEEAQNEIIQINGLLAFNYMKEQSARDMSAAMNTFETIEKNFSGSRSYPDAVEFAQRMLPALRAEVERRAKALATRKTDQAETIKKLVGPEKTAFENEVKSAKATADEAVSAAKKQGLKWLPLNPATEDSLKDLTSKITSEASHLSAVPIAKMRASIAAAEKARGLIVAKDLGSAETVLAQAGSDWSNNELATRLKTELDAAKKLAAADAAKPPVIMPDADILPPVAAEKKSPEPVEPVAEEVEKEKPFLLTAGGAITVVVIIALLLAAYSAFKKIKSKAGDILE